MEANSTPTARYATAHRPQVDVTLDRDGYARVVALRGEHDLATSEAVRVALRPMHGPVLVDLSDCEFVDSTIIEALLTSGQRFASAGQRLELLLPPAQSIVTRALELINVRDLLVVHDQPRSLFAEARSEA